MKSQTLLIEAKGGKQGLFFKLKKILHNNEVREAFFLLFCQGKKSLFMTGHARRVGCLFNSL